MLLHDFYCPCSVQCPSAVRLINSHAIAMPDSKCRFWMFLAISLIHSGCQGSDSNKHGDEISSGPSSHCWRRVCIPRLSCVQGIEETFPTCQGHPTHLYTWKHFREKKHLHGDFSMPLRFVIFLDLFWIFVCGMIWSDCTRHPNQSAIQNKPR